MASQATDEALRYTRDKVTDPERAKARWSILRNALLQKKRTSADDAINHSIHRFSGYQLLTRNARPDVSRFEASLKLLEWDSSQSEEHNIARLADSCLAVAALFPKGQCVKVSNCPNDKESWIVSLREDCRPSVHVLVVEDKVPKEITLLVQEGSKATRYQVCEYILDSNCSLWTREPSETRLSLKDLVSHRTTGVDNTGNVCVWDSELSLSYLLYHHWRDMPDLGIEAANPARILELGTGMAGLSAVSLGLSLMQSSQKAGSTTSHPVLTLTDGHPDGVRNNRVNRLLTALASSSLRAGHPYTSLDVSERVLLWTTEAESPLGVPQDLVLVSDCTHFQNFHAALAITVLRSLRVGGTAVFCQPTRGDSLDNFRRLITTTRTSNEDLVSLDWWTHAALTEQDYQAKENHPDLYDPNLHCPKILLVKKLREITTGDREAIIQHQETRDG